MIPHLLYYQLVILVLLWLCVMLPHLWPSPPVGYPREPADPLKPKRKRSTEPKPFEGLTQKPHCALCEQETAKPLHRLRHGPIRCLRPPTPPYGGHLAALLSPSRLSLSRLARAGQSPRQWPSQWRSLAAVPVHRVRRLFSGAPRHDLSWQAGRPWS